MVIDLSFWRHFMVSYDYLNRVPLHPIKLSYPIIISFASPLLFFSFQLAHFLFLSPFSSSSSSSLLLICYHGDCDEMWRHHLKFYLCLIVFSDESSHYHTMTWYINLYKLSNMTIHMVLIFRWNLSSNEECCANNEKHRCSVSIYN